MGILLGGLVGWLVYRCMLRKPVMPRDDGALLIGPRYIGIQEPERHHIQGQDIERHTQTKDHLPGVIHASPHFRWPSFNEKPAFHPDSGFHVPDEYLQDDDPLLALPLTTRPSTNVNARTKSTQTTHTSKSARTLKKSRRPTLRVAGPSLNDLSSPNSDTTSMALLELYESDEEEESRRKAREVPWESLRHKSIKRGILEQVKEEGKWLDSIRGLAGSTLLGTHPKTIMEEGSLLLGGRDADDSMAVESHVIGKRQGYSVPDSDPFANSPTRTHSISPRKRPVTKSRRTDSTTATFPGSVESHGIGFQIIPESAATTPNQSPRRSFAWLRKADASNALDKLTRLPTSGRKQSQSPSRSKTNRSTSPVKRTSNNGVDVSQVPRKDILPRSPTQLMSPPLHSQICFTPIPGPSAGTESQNSRDYFPKLRVMNPTKPLVVLNSSKSRKKVQSPQNLQRLPKPPLSANKKDTQGRVLQKPGTSHAVSCSKESAVASETQGDTMLEDPMKKVERIMASSWSARDLGQGGMRNLSPTGFGRRL